MHSLNPKKHFIPKQEQFKEPECHPLKQVNTQYDRQTDGQADRRQRSHDMLYE